MKNIIKQKNNIQNTISIMRRIFLSLIMITGGLLVLGPIAFADSAVLSALPLSATNTVSTPFNVSVSIDPSGNNVCVVKGTINFNNLSCQSITLSNGLMAQTIPTCDAPNFTIGIPKCASANQNLFSVSVKGNAAGQGLLSFSGVKVIGAGTDVAFSLQNSNYEIIPVVQEQEVVAPVSTTSENQTENVEAPVVQKPAENNKESGLQVPSGVGELNPIVGSTSEEIVSTTSSSSVSASSTENNGFVAAAIEAFSSVPDKMIISLILIVLAIMGGLLYYRKKDQDTTKTPDIPLGL